VKPVTKITVDDYPDLLAAVDAGTTQRELATLYGCAPSLIARKLKKAREWRDRAHRQDVLPADVGGPLEGPMEDILEARIRDPQTSPRDLASLMNALSRLREQSDDSSSSPMTYLRRATLILEPGPESKADADRHFRLIMRDGGGFQHVSGSGYDLSPKQALYLLICALGPLCGLSLQDPGFIQDDQVSVPGDCGSERGGRSGMSVDLARMIDDLLGGVEGPAGEPNHTLRASGAELAFQYQQALDEVMPDEQPTLLPGVITVFPNAPSGDELSDGL
jgi:hypothetical protein